MKKRKLNEEQNQNSETYTITKEEKELLEEAKQEKEKEEEAKLPIHWTRKVITKLNSYLDVIMWVLMIYGAYWYGKATASISHEQIIDLCTQLIQKGIILG